MMAMFSGVIEDGSVATPLLLLLLLLLLAAPSDLVAMVEEVSADGVHLCFMSWHTPASATCVTTNRLWQSLTIQKWSFA